MTNQSIASPGNFAEGSPSKIILRMAIPITLAELVHVLYNLVDRMYIGHMEGVGTEALSGIGISFPLITLITAFASLMGTGGNPLCSMARGKGDNEKAGHILETSFTMLIAASLILTVVLYALAEPLLIILGGDESTMPYALDYFRIYVLGSVFVLISLGMNPFINGMGFTKTGMSTVIIGAVLNIILDPVFIYRLGMGVKGAAIATIISQFVSAVWVMIFITGKRTLLRVTGFHFDSIQAVKIIKLGVTGFTFKVTTSITQAIVNMTLKQYGGADSTLYIGAMSIINSIREIFMMPVSGITTASVPFLSFNFGARLYQRVKKGIRFMSLSCLVYNTFMWAVIMLFPSMLIRIFTTDQLLVDMTVHCLRIFFSCYFLMTFQSSGQNTFIALNKPKEAVFFSLLRKMILVVPFTVLLPRLGLGADGVYYAEVLSQIIGASACFSTMFFTLYKKLPQDGMPADGRIDC